MTEKRLCTNCKHSRGLGYDFWCGEGHIKYEKYFAETDCPYFEVMDLQDNDFNNTENDSTNSRNEKRFELIPNLQGQVDIVDHVEGKEKNAICIYNDLGVLPFTSAPSLCDLLNALHEENEQLKDGLNQRTDQCDKYYKENGQLKQRNTRQAKQLDRLYNLIEQKDWRALNDILDDFKQCEEQLQREWGTYGDLE